MFKVLTALLPLASFVSAIPAPIQYNNGLGFIPTQAQIDEVEAANNVTAKILAIQERLGGIGCAGQSCDIADLAGSTGRLPKVKPEGGGTSDFKCIAKYNPAGIEAALKAPAVKAQPNGVSGALMGASHSLGNWIPGAAAADTGTFTGSCTKNIVIFAKGTTEVGSLGITVGPVLNAGLPRGFSVVGVPYTADLAGDYCLGLPGGMVARDMLNQAVKKCPDAKIFMSGYSQGGMISHNAVAYADEEARKHVAVSLIIPQTLFTLLDSFTNIELGCRCFR
jgi:Cutinase